MRCTSTIRHAPAPRAALAGERLAAVPKPTVESEALAANLRSAYRALARHALGATRDARFAGPHRERLWDAVDSLVASRPKGGDLARLRAPLVALRELANELGAYRDSGDEHLQARIFAGASAARPGLITLLGDVLAAAGLGRPAGIDHAAGGN